MKANVRLKKAMALAATLFAGASGVVLAQRTDTNATTVAYWQLGAAISDANSPSGSSIADLATNVGSGSLTGQVPNLWLLGNLAGSPTFAASVPPSGLFNSSGAFNGGTASWDAGADEYAYFPSYNGEVDCDNGAYGDIFNAPNFTEEVIFKTDYANDPTLGTVKQTLVWNHQNSAYCHLQINESAAGNTNDIGSLLFWGWNVQNFVTCRVTAAQNGGQRLDDGHWHYAAARYNNATLTMDLLVVNEDGSSSESSTFIGAPMNPGGSGSQGPLILGNDEGGNTPLDGQINQVRFSSAYLAPAKLLAKVTGCSAPVFPVASATTNTITVGSGLSLSPATWPAQVEGGPIQYQWQLNGASLPGQTNLALIIKVATAAQSGTYEQIATSTCGATVTSPPMVVSVVPAIPLAHWAFNFTEDVTYPQATVDDVIPGESYDLITFNNQPNLSGIGGNGEIPLTNAVPPATMFTSGNNGGTNAFDPSYLAGQDGVVFYPAGPDVFDFTASFSLELFFRTYGDQSADGTMELICQGTDGGNTFRYGVNVNQAGPGALTFNINNYALPPTGSSYEDFNNPSVKSVVLSNQNYADGNWHYLLAKYDSIGNTISLNVANQDGTATNAVVALPAGYSPLASSFQGNLFVGRYRYPWSDDNRNFFGSIDEVQVSSGLITPASGQLGYLPVPPGITGITLSGGKVTITFTGSPTAAASSYTLVGSPTVNGTFSALAATVSSLGGGNFQATVAASGASEFYKIKH